MPLISEFSCKCGKKVEHEECASYAVLPDGSEIHLMHPCENLRAAELLKKYPDWDRKVITKYAFICPSCASVAMIAAGKQSGPLCSDVAAAMNVFRGMPKIEAGKCKCGAELISMASSMDNRIRKVRCSCGAMAQIRSGCIS